MRSPASARRRLPRDARSSIRNRSNLIVWSQPFGGYWMAANEPLVTSEYTSQHASADAPQQAAPEASVTKTRRRLFTKYVALFVAVVCIALVSNGVFDVFFYYQEHKASLIRIQREQAEAAAAKIGQFIKEIESQLGWTTQLPWSAGSIEQRRFDALRLLRQVPAITELAQLDATGKERLRVSRLAMDVVASGADLSNDPKFAEAVARRSITVAQTFPHFACDQLPYARRHEASETFDLS